jgi:deoxyribodipyrimidine photo-lyase
MLEGLREVHDVLMKQGIQFVVKLESPELAAMQPAREASLEELVVRRELSMNFVHYNAHYDTFEALPEWAKDTLKAHQKDL